MTEQPSREDLQLSKESARVPVVLIVDDEEAVRLVLRLNLSHAGFEVREADSGEAALKQIEESIPDLVLLDLMMPGMNGAEVCRVLRADERTAELPILMLSARTDAASREQGLAAGATQYLTKPQMPDMLIRHVREALSSVVR